MPGDENKDQDIELDVDDEDLNDEDILDLTPEDPLLKQYEDECKRSQDLIDQLQRMQAEFDNFRKRMENRFEEISRFASEDIVLKILDVYDNLLRSLDMDFTSNPQQAKAGIEAIQKQMDKILVNEGVRPIESLGKEFDPYYQNALNRSCDMTKPDGVVLEEYQRGYMFKEKVLRPAIVCVNKHETNLMDENNDTSNEKNSEESGE